MRQLGQLQKNVGDFEKLNTQMVFVFREEAEGVEGLKKIEKRIKGDAVGKIRLGLDFEKKSSEPYSTKKMTFNNYVIDSKGKIRGAIDGTLRDRATVEELTKILKEVQADKE